MIKDWFDAAPVTKFGISLAQNYAREFALISKMQKHKREEKQKKLVANVMAQVKAFGANNKMNIYKKAKLGNAIKWTLRDLDFDREMIDALVKEIFLALT